METRGFLRLLGSCFPLVLAFLTAAVLAAPVSPQSGPIGSAFGTDRAVSAAAAARQPGPAATVHLEADQSAAVPMAVVAALPAAVVAVAPRALRDTASRAPAAPRGPPHLLA